MGNATTSLVPVSGVGPNMSISRAQEKPSKTDGAPQVLVLREGESLPEEYTFLVCALTTPTVAPKFTEMVDLTTPDAASHMSMEDLDTSKRNASERRNVTKSSNKQAHASFTKDVKDSLAGGRPPAMNVSEEQTYLKAR